MVHRNVHIFNRPQVRVYNNTRFTGMPQTQQCNCNSSGSIWSNPMMLMMMGQMGGGLLSGIADIIRSGREAKATPKNDTPAGTTPPSIELNALKELYGDKWKIVELDGKFTAVNKTDGTQHVDKTYQEMLEALKPAVEEKPAEEVTLKTDPNAISVESARARIKEAGLEGKITITDDGKIKYTKPATGQEITLTLNETNLGVAIAEILSHRPENDAPVSDKPTYSIEENKSLRETVKTIPYGGPWHYAHYYKDANGTQIKIGGSDFNAIVQKLKTEMGSVEGNKGLRTLPSTITVNGNTYTIMNETERDGLGLKGKSGGSDVTYSVIASNSTYSVYKTDADGNKTLVQGNLTQEAANALKTQKEAE